VQRQIVNGICIDNQFTRYRDDAIWAESVGEYHVVSVSIADVTELVAPGSSADEEASRRGFTLYGAHSGSGPQFMLPEHILSAASLESSGRPTTTITLVLGGALETISCRVFPSVLRQRGRLSFAEADEALVDESHPLNSRLYLCGLLAEKLRARRRQKGAIVLDRLDLERYSLERASEEWHKHAHHVCAEHIVEEFILLAGGALARWCLEQNIPVLFRNLTKPIGASEKERLLRDIDRAYREALTPEELLALQYRVETISAAAYYSPYPADHAVLRRLHIRYSSPLRRYADLVNHQQIARALRGETPGRSERQLLSIAHQVNAREAEWRGGQTLTRALRRAARDPWRMDETLRWRVFLRGRSQELDGEMCLAILVLARADKLLWRGVKLDTLKALAAEPALVRTVFARAHAELGWPLPIIDTVEDTSGRFLGLARLESNGERFAAVSDWQSGKERAADEAALSLLALISGIPNASTPRRLDVLAKVRGFREPRYSIREKSSAALPWTCMVRTNIPLARNGGPISIATAATKDEARIRAASALMTRILFESEN
jgi:ribonuclease R